MVARIFFALGAAFLVLAVPSSAQYWRQQNGYTYQQVYPPQQNYPNYQRPQVGPQKQGYQQQQTSNQWSLPPGVSVSNTEWVCKNPKTGDMMIIASEDVPVQPGTNGQQQPNYPRPPVNQPTYPQTQQPNVQPNYPTVNPSWPGNQPTQQPPQPQQPNQGTPPSSNGEGIIDIRFGESK